MISDCISHSPLTMAKRMKFTCSNGMMNSGSYKLNASFMRNSHTPTKASHPSSVAQVNQASRPKKMSTPVIQMVTSSDKTLAKTTEKVPNRAEKVA